MTPGLNPPPTINPTSISLAPGGSQQISVNAAGGRLSPTSVSVGDSCVARVSAGGLVTAVGSGTTLVQLAFSLHGLTYLATVPVNVTTPAVLRLTFQSITSGMPPAGVDPGAVRGTVAVTVNADAATFASVELLLAGRSVETRRVEPDTGLASVTFTFDTDARDAAGARLYANGPQILLARATDRPRPFSCPRPATTGTIQQAITLANP